MLKRILSITLSLLILITICCGCKSLSNYPSGIKIENKVYHTGMTISEVSLKLSVPSATMVNPGQYVRLAYRDKYENLFFFTAQNTSEEAMNYNDCLIAYVEASYLSMRKPDSVGLGKYTFDSELPDLIVAFGEPNEKNESQAYTTCLWNVDDGGGIFVQFNNSNGCILKIMHGKYDVLKSAFDGESASGTVIGGLDTIDSIEPINDLGNCEAVRWEGEEERFKTISKLEPVKFDEFYSLENADITAQEITKKLKEITDYKDPNFCLYSVADMNANCDTQQRGYFETNSRYHNHFAIKNDKFMTYIAAATRTTKPGAVDDAETFDVRELEGGGYEFDDAKLIYGDTENYDIYAKFEYGKDSAEWMYESVWFMYVDSLVAFTTSKDIPNNIVIKDDNNGHYIIRMKGIAEMKGLMGTAMKGIGSEPYTDANAEIYYIIEKDFSAIRVCILGATFNDAFISSVPFDAESQYNFYGVIYNIGKVTDKMVTPPKEALDLKTSPNPN